MATHDTNNLKAFSLLFSGLIIIHAILFLMMGAMSLLVVSCLVFSIALVKNSEKACLQLAQSSEECRQIINNLTGNAVKFTNSNYYFSTLKVIQTEYKKFIREAKL